MPVSSALAASSLFADVPVEVEIDLDRRMMQLRDILALTTGSIIAMPKVAGDYLDISVAGARVGRGEVVMLEKGIGVRITMFEPKA